MKKGQIPSSASKLVMPVPDDLPKLKSPEPFQPDNAKESLDASFKTLDSMINNVCHKQWEAQVLTKKLKPHTIKNDMAVMLKAFRDDPIFKLELF